MPSPLFETFNLHHGVVLLCLLAPINRQRLITFLMIQTHAMRRTNGIPRHLLLSYSFSFELRTRLESRVISLILKF